MNTEDFIEQYFYFPFSDCIDKIQQKNDGFDIEIVSAQANVNLEISKLTNKYTVKNTIISANPAKENLIIICIKDNPNLLNFCLTKIQENDISNYSDIFVVDDRPSSTDNLDIVKEHKNISYCQINNDMNIFNYSVINNIAAAYGRYLDKKRLIFWNSDLWPTTKYTIPNLLEKHISNQSNISGTKLIYPSQEDYGIFFGKYNHILGQNLQNAFLTIQHGGIIWGYQKAFQSLYPTHQWRFYPRDHDMASVDNRCLAVTGALHIINIEDFIELGGYSVSFSVSFQDIDICQRAYKSKMKVYYFGTEELFHAETITNKVSYNTGSQQMMSDNIIYRYVWSKSLPKLLGYTL